MDTHAQRKDEHLTVSLAEDVAFRTPTTGLECYQFVHNALPELDLAEVDPSATLWGKRMRAPLLISAMTGGTARATAINRRLATAAQKLGLAFGVGSQRPAIENSQLETTYDVRGVAPDVPLLANLGAVQLNYGYSIGDCRRAVEMIQADSLVLHLNPMQECLQANGNTDFSGLLARIEELCRDLHPVPVVVKECGWGISETVATRLAEAGVAAIDVAGAGGTSWTKIEGARARDATTRRIAATFDTWGIPTADSLLMARRGAPNATLIASGGIRTGLDGAKSLALGADLFGIAHPLLQPATISDDAVVSMLSSIVRELRIAMFCAGARTLDDLRAAPLLRERSQ